MAESLSIYIGMKVKVLSDIDDKFVDGKVVKYDEDENIVTVEDVCWNILF